VLISTLAGLLKALLNVHEVVTSIMLNWIVWYFIKWYDKDIMTSTGSQGTPDITQAEGHNYADWFNLASNPITIGLIFVVASIVITWVVMTFTTVGYKFKVVGNQQDAAKYAGIQAKLYIILTMAVQGLLIGLGSFIYYVQIKGKLEIASDTIPTIGFDALTIPLVAFNNVFGMIPIALLWATIQSGMDIATVSEQGLQREVGSLMYGFIIYGAQRRFVKYSPELVALSTKMAALKGKKEAEYDYLRAKKEYKIELRSKMMTFKNEISQYKNEIKVLHGKALANFGIFWTGTHASAYKNKNRFELFEVLDGITREKVNRQVHMDREVQQRAGEISELKQKLHNAKQDNDVEMAGVFQDQINEINSIIKQKHAHIDEQFDKIFQDMISVYEQQARARKDEYLQKRTALKNDLRAIRDKVKQDAVAASAENKSLLTAAKATNNEINQRYKTQIADAKKGQADNMSEQIWKLQLDWVKERQANSFKFEKTSLYKVLDYKYQEEMGVDCGDCRNDFGASWGH
jgi:branched-subunit amino acid ABC-type transport system permease component